MVTEMDHASEALIRERLLGARPDDGFLGEETGQTAGTSGVRWVVDPLDGTTNYLYGYPGCNVSIAAEDEDGAVVAVVVDPLLGDMFAAVRGGGAHRNGAPIACSTRTETSPPRSAPPASPTTRPPPRARPTCSPRSSPGSATSGAMGAAAVDLCSVACGRVDAYWERGLGPWDLAAGSLIAAEAGATRRRRRRPRVHPGRALGASSALSVTFWSRPERAEA